MLLVSDAPTSRLIVATATDKLMFAFVPMVPDTVNVVEVLIVSVTFGPPVTELLVPVAWVNPRFEPLALYTTVFPGQRDCGATSCDSKLIFGSLLSVAKEGLAIPRLATTRAGGRHSDSAKFLSYHLSSSLAPMRTQGPLPRMRETSSSYLGCFRQRPNYYTSREKRFSTQK